MALTLGLSSCKDFLTIVPSDARFLGDVQSLKQTLASWLYNYTENGKYNSMDAPWPWIPTFTSNKYWVYADVWDFNKLNSKDKLSESDMRDIGRLGITSYEWGYLYELVGYMNLILNEIDTAEGDDDMRRYVKGEALIHRAFAFYKLLQCYAPMNDAAMGIPVYTDTYGSFDDADLSRRNQSVAFDRILSDLSEAERLLGLTPPRDSYNVMYNYDHVYRIRAMVYLWKACGPVAEPTDWENAAKAAKAAIAAVGNILPMDVERLDAVDFFGDGMSFNFPKSGYPEALYYIVGDEYLTDYGYDIELWRTLYTQNDNRKYKWFGVPQDKDPALVTPDELKPGMKKKGFFYGFYMPTVYFRLSEQYLILAEAYAHTNFEEGKRVLRQWQSVRYKAGTESEWFVPASQEELLQEIYRERRREFIGEGDLMWFDLKRLGATDTGRSAKGYTAPALTEYDFRYCFKIPASETETNHINPNPGWEDYETL